jgi:hypothetical protein
MSERLLSRAAINFLFAMFDSRASKHDRAARVAAFDETRTWVDPNGYRLSDRVWRNGASLRVALDRTITTAIADGTSALRLAAQLERYISPAYARTRFRNGKLVLTGQTGGAGSYPARRLARTEITRAHGVATVKATAAIPGALVAWRLSGSHPEADICDRNAANGPYEPERIPGYPAHPQDLCTLTTVFAKSDAEIVAELRRLYGLA